MIAVRYRQLLIFSSFLDPKHALTAQFEKCNLLDEIDRFISGRLLWKQKLLFVDLHLEILKHLLWQPGQKIRTYPEIIGKWIKSGLLHKRMHQSLFIAVGDEPRVRIHDREDEDYDGIYDEEDKDGSDDSEPEDPRILEYRSLSAWDNGGVRRKNLPQLSQSVMPAVHIIHIIQMVSLDPVLLPTLLHSRRKTGSFLSMLVRHMLAFLRRSTHLHPANVMTWEQDTPPPPPPPQTDEETNETDSNKLIEPITIIYPPPPFSVELLNTIRLLWLLSRQGVCSLPLSICFDVRLVGAFMRWIVGLLRFPNIFIGPLHKRDIAWIFVALDRVFEGMTDGRNEYFLKLGPNIFYLHIVLHYYMIQSPEDFPQGLRREPFERLLEQVEAYLLTLKKT